jgi:hypothetical protein
MADLVHPDSDWASLGNRLMDRSKPFQRLERPTTRAPQTSPTPAEVEKAKAILALHKKQQRIKRPNGRPRKHPDLMKAALLRERGLSWEKVAEALGVHRNTLCLKRKEMLKVSGKP